LSSRVGYNFFDVTAAQADHKSKQARHQRIE